MLPGSSRAVHSHSMPQQIDVQSTKKPVYQVQKSIVKLDTQETRKTHLESASTRSTLRSMLCSIQSLQSIHSIPSTGVYIYYTCISLHEWRAGHMHLCTGTCVCVPSYVFPHLSMCLFCMYVSTQQNALPLKQLRFTHDVFLLLCLWDPMGTLTWHMSSSSGHKSREHIRQYWFGGLRPRTHWCL